MLRIVALVLCGAGGCSDVPESKNDVVDADTAVDGTTTADADAAEDLDGTDDRLDCQVSADEQQTGNPGTNTTGRFYEDLGLSVHSQALATRPSEAAVIRLLFDQFEPDIGPPLMRFQPDALRVLLAWDARGCVDGGVIDVPSTQPPSAIRLEGFTTAASTAFGALVEFEYLGVTHRVAVERRCCLDDGEVGGS